LPDVPPRRSRPALRFESSQSSCEETDGAMQLRIVMDAAQSADAVVWFALTGLATAGEDYTLSADHVVLEGGTQEATVDLTIIDDNQFEQDETIVLTLIQTVNSEIGSPATHTVTIHNVGSSGEETASRGWMLYE
jgi:hypothetical protein